MKATAALLVALCLANVQRGTSRAQIAPGRRLAVLQLDSDAVHDPTARALTDSLRTELSHREEFVLLITPISLAQLSIVHDCDSTHNACLDKVAKELNVDDLVFGKLTTERGGEVVHLHHFESSTGIVKTSALATLALRSPSPDDIDRKAHELVFDLFQLEPQRSPFARQELAGKSGVAGDPNNPDLKLQAADSTLSGREVAGYALLGGAVLSTGLSVLSFIQIDRAQSNDTFERYRRAVGQLRPSARDVCDEAASGQNYGLDSAAFQRVKSNCGTGRTFEILQFVFIGGAVLSSGLSAYLLLGPKLSNVPVGDAKVTLHPNVSKNGASLGARFKF